MSEPQGSFRDTLVAVAQSRAARHRAWRIRLALLLAALGGAMAMNAVAGVIGIVSTWESTGTGGRIYVLLWLLILWCATVTALWGANQVLITRNPNHPAIRAFTLLGVWTLQLNSMPLDVLPVSVSTGWRIGPGAIHLNLLGVILLLWHRWQFGDSNRVDSSASPLASTPSAT